MAFEIPSQNGEPTIKVFETADELHRETGQKACHGFFDARANMILATSDSVAHEVGHYLDFKSGKLLLPEKIADSRKRNEALLRNEIVAILFAYAKCGAGGTSLSYESQFVEWLNFTRTSRSFGPHPERNLRALKFSEIQDLSTWLVTSSQPWFEQLSHFFKGYLADEKNIFTYGQKSIRLKKA